MSQEDREPLLRSSIEELENRYKQYGLLYDGRQCCNEVLLPGWWTLAFSVEIRSAQAFRR